MNRKRRLLAVLLAALAIGQPMAVKQSIAAPKTFPLVSNAGYLKECGSCHMAYPPELLPARSWTKILGSLQDHFGDSAQLDDATQQRIHDYLVANSADKAQNEESFAVMKSLRPGETPLRITGTPYIAGLHAAVLDPLWEGNPRPKTLAECGVCHHLAQTGNFTMRQFSVSDDAFRGHGEQ
jgi:cytochrome c553